MGESVIIETGEAGIDDDGFLAIGENGECSSSNCCDSKCMVHGCDVNSTDPDAVELDCSCDRVISCGVVLNPDTEIDDAEAVGPSSLQTQTVQNFADVSIEQLDGAVMKTTGETTSELIVTGPTDFSFLFAGRAEGGGNVFLITSAFTDPVGVLSQTNLVNTAVSGNGLIGPGGGINLWARGQDVLGPTTASFARCERNSSGSQIFETTNDTDLLPAAGSLTGASSQHIDQCDHLLGAYPVTLNTVTNCTSMATLTVNRLDSLCNYEIIFDVVHTISFSGSRFRRGETVPFLGFQCNVVEEGDVSLSATRSFQERCLVNASCGRPIRVVTEATALLGQFNGELLLAGNIPSGIFTNPSSKGSASLTLPGENPVPKCEDLTVNPNATLE